MESLTRLVTESLARHGFDRPLDYRRLHWSRWFRCESHHSLLLVPSKPGVFALAEEIIHFAPGSAHVEEIAHAGAGDSPARRSEASEGRQDPSRNPGSSTNLSFSTNREGHDFSRAVRTPSSAALAAEGTTRRMLAVSQFYESDDMAFVLDRMLAGRGPMADRLTSGRYFARFVVIEDAAQRHNICSALNQWMISSAETATGIGSHFASSLELTDATEYIAQPDPAQRNLFGDANENAAHAILLASANSDGTPTAAATIYAKPAGSSEAQSPTAQPTAAPQQDSGAASNLHCPTPFPSGF